MKDKRSLNAKSMAVFLLISVSLLIFLIYGSYHTKHVVISQVARSSQNLATMYMNAFDTTMEAVDTKLYYLVEHDEDLLALGLSSALYDEERYYFAKIRLLDTLSHDISYFKGVDMYYAYSTGYDEFIRTAQQGAGYEKSQLVQQKLAALLQDSTQRAPYLMQWKTLQIGQDYYLIRLVQTEFDVILGVLIDLQRMKTPMDSLDFGSKGSSLFVNASGEVLAGSDGPQPATSMFRGNPDRDLIIQAHSQRTDVGLVVMLPKAYLLEQLTLFQWIVNALPVAVGVVFIFFLIGMRKVFLQPIRQLIQGMRMIQRGDLEARLPGGNSREFAIINETFNSMASQIKHLKINVYEEQIKVQRAELKHLQVQINPHFFLNSLNIIYTLAEVKENQLVQRMALYLSKYFRFITGTNRSAVKLREEMDHIHTYLQIQRLRFPEHLAFTITLPTELEDYEVPALIAQPFVENAMIHGFTMSDTGFHIDITVECSSLSPGYISIGIQDNGPGFAPEQLEQLHNSAFLHKEDADHIGIWNVVYRLTLRYQGQASIAFRNREEGGAEVRLHLPVAIQGNEEQEAHTHA